MSAETPETEPESLHVVARQELVCLWDDLQEARSSALNGEWSMQCDQLVWRIEALTKLLGPTPWDAIPMPLLEDGIYQRIHADMGVNVDVDMAQVADIRASLNARDAHRAPQ